jgi:hypothetical protein
MPQNQFDKILNFAIPALLILVVIAFVWTKMIGAWLGPQLAKFWQWLKGEGEAQQHKRKEIVYE